MRIFWMVVGVVAALPGRDDVPLADSGSDVERDGNPWAEMDAGWASLTRHARFEEFRFSTQSIHRASDFYTIDVDVDLRPAANVDPKLFVFRRRLYFMKEDFLKGASCEERFKTHYQAQQTRKVAYLESISEPMFYTAENGANFCLVMGETGADLTAPLFTHKDFYVKSKNTERIIKLIARIVYGFATLNALGNVYHANINRQAILVFREGDEQSDFLPRITNLATAFKMTLRYKQVSFQVYDAEHRPPEIDRREIRSVFPAADLMEEQAMHYFDLNFKEEAYALGITLTELLHLNEDFLDPKSKRLDRTKKIIQMMLVPDPEKRNSIRKTLKLLREHVSYARAATKPILWLPSQAFAVF